LYRKSLVCTRRGIGAFSVGLPVLWQWPASDVTRSLLWGAVELGLRLSRQEKPANNPVATSAVDHDIASAISLAALL